jgi:hypothetical protein
MSRPLLVLCLALVFASPALSETPSEEPDNLRVTFTVGRLDGGRAVPLKSYELLVADGGEPARFTTGARVPIPATAFNTAGKDGEAVPVTSFTYQNVGFQATVEAQRRDDGRIRLHGAVEDSSLGTPVQGRPVILTLNQRIDAVLDPGVTLRLNRIEEAHTEGSTRTFYLEVRAEPVE